VGAADRLRAFRRARFLYLSVCGFVGLFVCLWGCDEIRREIHGVSFVVSSFVDRQLLPNPNKNWLTPPTNGTTLAQGGGGRGNRKTTPIKNHKKTQTGRTKIRIKTCFLKCGAIFLKFGGLNGWAFTVVLLTNIIKMAYKT
jgi:hypothetical protein